MTNKLVKAGIVSSGADDGDGSVTDSGGAADSGGGATGSVSSDSGAGDGDTEGIFCISSSCCC